MVRLMVAAVVVYIVFQACTYQPYIQIGCTGSMEPALSCGDRYAVEDVGPESVPLAVGQIVVFQACFRDRSPGMTQFVHRIIDVRTVDGETEYRMKGDANKLPDSCWVKHERVYQVLLHKLGS
ncbi:MAG: signal peptidase I [Chloroflexi bacterium]|nr:signal peptidase I [Chloroflexota bacterium]